MSTRDELEALELRLELRVRALREAQDAERKALLVETLELLVDKYHVTLEKAILNRVFD